MRRIVLLLGLSLFIGTLPAQGQNWVKEYLKDGFPHPDSLVADLESEMQGAIGKEAPSFPFRPIGETRSETLADYAGKTVVVNFWKTNCSGCIAQLPYLAKLQKMYADQELAVIYISPEDQKTLNRFISEHDMAGVKRTMDLADLSRPYQLLATPSAFVVDPEGKVRAAWIGPQKFEQIEKRVAPYVVSR